MSDRIHLLSEKVANQIAAGEVIQRPASAVKELLENALDAGATKITLVVKDAGKTLIQVVDDGCGMSEVDARICFARHATSKLQTFEDLAHLSTKGFRGEAMASIASIAQIELKTRQSGAEVGTLVEIEGGSAPVSRPCSCPIGTAIAVKNLFYNVPARRKFLKSDNAEFRHILEEFERVAIPHASVAFTLVHNDQIIYQLEPSHLKMRLIKLYGNHFAEKIVPVEETTDLVSIYGYIGKPTFAKKSRGEQFFFVNNRFVKSPRLNQAVVQAFKELLPKESFPTYFVFLELDPAKTDINIHPTKTEVKFEDEQAVFIFLLSAVKKSLGQYNLTPLLDFTQDPATANFPVFSNKEGMPPAPTIKVNTSFNPFETSAQQSANGQHYKSQKQHQQEWSAMLNSIHEANLGAANNEIEEGATLAFKDTMLLQQEQKVMQIHGQFIIAQVKSGVLLIEQKGAHERILYETFLRHQDDFMGLSQKLLFPCELQLSQQDELLLEENLLLFKHFGIEIAKEKTGIYQIEGVPVDFLDTNEIELFETVMENIKHTDALNREEKKSRMAYALSKKGKIKAGTLLNDAEMRNLIEQLFRCKQPSLSPDNRNIVTILSLGHIASLLN